LDELRAPRASRYCSRTVMYDHALSTYREGPWAELEMPPAPRRRRWRWLVVLTFLAGVALIG